MPTPFLTKIACAHCVLFSAISSATHASDDYQPQVLLTFDKLADDAGATAASARNPHLPPVYNPTDGKLYGVTPEGGKTDKFPPGFPSVDNMSTQYQLSAENPEDYISTSSRLSVMQGFYSGVSVSQQGMVLSTANPLPVPLPGFSTQGLVFTWNNDGLLDNLIPDNFDYTSVEPHFVPRGLSTFDAEGNFYFGGGDGQNGMALFRRNTEGEIHLLVDFSQTAYQQNDNYLKGRRPAQVIYSAADNALYGLAAQVSGKPSGDPDKMTIDNDTPAGTLFKIPLDHVSTDGNTPVDILHTFAQNAEGAIAVDKDQQNALVEDDEWLYGTSTLALWRIKKSDATSFDLIHTFGQDDNDGMSPFGPLALAEDGHVYGTTISGKAPEDGSEALASSGTLFRVTTGSADDRSDDTYEKLHDFNVEQEGASPRGLTLGATKDGKQALYGVTKFGGDDGNTINNGFGTLFYPSVNPRQYHGVPL